IDGVELDQESDLYRSMATARVVVGYASTVLFEALAFGVRTLVIESGLSDMYTPREVFGDRIAVNASGVETIHRASLAPTEAETSALVERVWKRGAVDNFNDFLLGNT